MFFIVHFLIANLPRLNKPACIRFTDIYTRILDSEIGPYIIQIKWITFARKKLNEIVELIYKKSGFITITYYMCAFPKLYKDNNWEWFGVFLIPFWEPFKWYWKINKKSQFVLCQQVQNTHKAIWKRITKRFAVYTICRQEYNKRVVYSKPQCIRMHHGVSSDWSPDWDPKKKALESNWLSRALESCCGAYGTRIQFLIHSVPIS